MPSLIASMTSVLRGRDLTAMAVASYLTLTYGLALGLLIVGAVWAGEELDNYI